MDVAAWLSSLGLECYKQAFEVNAIDGAVLPRLTADDLRDIGITAVGHRRKLLEAIAGLQEASGGRRPTAHLPASPLRPREAERRQLTVMFIDLVGSTLLAARLDPEDMREVLTAYQNCCSEVVQRFAGYVAKLMGDGVLVYFGWPSAHEDDAERTVLAGLEVVAAVAALKPCGDLKLAARVGISTGNVVVGDLIGVGAAQEQAVVGETPNLAARIQSLAKPGTVVIGPSTRKLLGASFECEDLGDRTLAGVKETVRIWRVLRPSQRSSRFDALRGAALVPLVGREEELSILARRWDLTKEGKGQVVVLSGEPGIGKSRLVRALWERIAEQEPTRLVYQCSPIQMGRAYHPIIAQIERAAHITAQDDSEQNLAKLRGVIGRAAGALADDLAVFAALLSLPGDEGFSEIEPDPKQRKARILAAFLRQFEGLAAQRAVLCIFEDIHWSDPSTMEFLEQLVEWIPARRVLLLVTCRPEFASPWTGLAHCTLLSLNRMSTSETAELVAGVAGGQLPDEVVHQILAKTDGIPIFAEELTRAVIESAILRRSDGGYALTGALPALAVPATLHDSLMARLDRLPGARQIAQLAAAIGRSPDYGLLSAVTGDDDATLGGALTQLEEAGLLIRRGTPPDSSYSFKHALIQDAAYGSILRATRQDYHRRIAIVLERQSPGLARTDAALLAHHYAEGGLTEAAVRCFRQAGETAVEASAYAEAIANFTKGLALLDQLPESPERACEEIAIRLALGGAQVPSLARGAAEAEQTYTRALALSQEFGAAKDRFAALWGLWYCHYQPGNIYRSREYGDQLLPLAREVGDPALLLEAHHVGWSTTSVVGDPRAALAHSKEGMARYDAEQHQRLAFVYGGHDPGVCAQTVNALMLCILGYPEQAQRRSEAALALGRKLAHPLTLGQAHVMALMVALLVRDLGRMEQLVSDLDALLRCDSVQRWISADAECFRGYMLGERGAVEDGLVLMHRSREIWQQRSAWSFMQAAGMADLLGKAGRAEEGLRLTERTLLAAEHGGAHWYDAELYRVRAGLRQALDAESWREAEKDLAQAIATARAQSARYLELRAATDLARLWIARNERERAHDLLAPVLDGFTEGFGLPDLVTAKAWLEAAVH